MIKNLSTYVIILFLLTLNIGCEKEDDLGLETQEINTGIQATNLQLEISGFNNLDGKLAIAVFNSSSSFESENEAYRDSILSITSLDMSVLIEDITPGTYAISVFHDADESGDITFGGFLNLIPQEGFGFSNNPNIGMSQPSYNDCSFIIEQNQTLLIPITLVYL